MSALIAQPSPIVEAENETASDVLFADDLDHDPLALDVLVASPQASQADEMWEPGTMGSGEGERKSGDRVLQHRMNKAWSRGSYVSAGGRAQRNWKLKTDVGYGIQTQDRDGETRGRTQRKTGTLFKGFDKTTSSEARSYNGETDVERRSYEKTRGDERWTTTREYSSQDGTSSVQREVEQRDWDGRERTLDESSYSGKKNGRYVV
ncbi:MAG: hypothetical protein AAFV53_42695, partial [Myxococcota bacterium]